MTIHKQEPKSGEIKSVVMFVHGYGADGQDLLGLANPLAEYLPDTQFVSPDAPHRCSINPMGFEWFPIPRMDGSDPAMAHAKFLQAADHLNALIDNVVAEAGIDYAKFVLLGFSQGTMLSLHVAPRRSSAIAGVLGYSGRLLVPEALQSDDLVKMPIQLIHGDIDDVVPYTDMQEAEKNLSNAGFDVRAHTSKGTAHGIAPDGLGVGLQFIQSVLG